MRLEGYRFRGYGPADLRREVGLWERVDPARGLTLEELEERDRILAAPGRVSERFVLEQGATGRVAAVGRLESAPDTGESAGLWGSLAVDPDLQHRGLGTVVACHIEEAARSRRTQWLWVRVRSDDARALRFLARRGFEARRKSWRARLELARARPLPDRTATLAAGGIDVRPLGTPFPPPAAVLRELVALNLETAGDIPRVGPYAPAAMEPYILESFHSPRILPEGFFTAWDGTRLVGLSYVETVSDDPTTLYQALTAVRREWRGRGIATELKRRVVEYARGAGYAAITTTYDAENRPVVALNDRLGFARTSERVVAEKSLSSGDSRGSDPPRRKAEDRARERPAG